MNDLNVKTKNSLQKPLKITSSFKGDFYVTNDYLFSNLSECRMKWKIGRASCRERV